MLMEVLSFPDGFRKAFLLDVNEGIEEALKKLLLPDDLVSLIVRDIDRVLSYVVFFRYT
ncbi:MAG: hypothetical protein ACP5JF_05410 [Candidatus Methanodesulfokora sp.]|jgi:hypothetical protein